MLKEDRDNYEKFFKDFGMQLKYGIYSSYGMKKDVLQDLLIFKSSKEKKYVTLKEYVDNMKKDQKNIYYACGESIDKIDLLPQVETVKDKDYEILYLTDYMDEFVFKMMMEYSGKKFMNVQDEKLDLDSDKEKEQLEKKNKENSDMFTSMKNYLNDKVSKVQFTHKLKNHPVCLTTVGDVSTEMEKVLNQMPNNEGVKAEVILEINENHPISKKLEELNKKGKTEELEKYTKILYSEARLIEGLPIDNPTELTNLVCELISK